MGIVDVAVIVQIVVEVIAFNGNVMTWITGCINIGVYSGVAALGYLKSLDGDIWNPQQTEAVIGTGYNGHLPHRSGNSAEGKGIYRAETGNIIEEDFT